MYGLANILMDWYSLCVFRNKYYLTLTLMTVTCISAYIDLFIRGEMSWENVLGDIFRITNITATCLLLWELLRYVFDLTHKDTWSFLCSLWNCVSLGCPRTSRFASVLMADHWWILYVSCLGLSSNKAARPAVETFPSAQPRILDLCWVLSSGDQSAASHLQTHCCRLYTRRKVTIIILQNVTLMAMNP